MDISVRMFQRTVALLAAALVSQRVEGRPDHSPLTVIDTADRFVKFMEGHR